jgi:hypothetical protein
MAAVSLYNVFTLPIAGRLHHNVFHKFRNSNRFGFSSPAPGWQATKRVGRHKNMKLDLFTFLNTLLFLYDMCWLNEHTPEARRKGAQIFMSIFFLFILWYI